jgi:hypothetical protein
MSTSSAPKFIPSFEELSSVERDLRFYPSTTDHPKTLTPEQILAFNRDGYLKGIRVFNPEEISGIGRYFDELLARTLAAGGDSYSISTAHLRQAAGQHEQTRLPPGTQRDVLARHEMGGVPV